jgi:hypothetical protein
MFTRALALALGLILLLPTSVSAATVHPDVIKTTVSGSSVTVSWGPIPSDLGYTNGMYEAFLGKRGFHNDGSPGDYKATCRTAPTASTCTLKNIPAGSWDVVVYATSTNNKSYPSKVVSIRVGKAPLAPAVGVACESKGEVTQVKGRYLECGAKKKWRLVTLNQACLTPDKIVGSIFCDQATSRWRAQTTACAARKDVPAPIAWNLVATNAMYCLAQLQREGAEQPQLELTSLFPSYATKQSKLWFTRALTAGNQIFGRWLKNPDQKIGLIYATSFDDGCSKMKSLLQSNGASADLPQVETLGWACAGESPFSGWYVNPGFGATVFTPSAGQLRYVIYYGGRGDELREQSTSQLNNNFQTPPHELFHLVQDTRRAGMALWWTEGAAYYVGHVAAALGNFVSLQEQRNLVLEQLCSATLYPVAEMEGQWEDPWWGRSTEVYSIGYFASEYLIGTYGWLPFLTFGDDTSGDAAWIEGRAQIVFGTSASELRSAIDTYVREQHASHC